MLRGYTLKYSIIQFIQETDGIRKSKHVAKKQYEGVSPCIHSFATKHRYGGIINEFKESLLKKGIKRVNQFTPEHLIEFLEEKAVRIKQKTVLTNTAALKKFFQSSPWRWNREPLLEALEEHHCYLLDLAREDEEAIPFSDPERVIQRLKESPHKAIATIQLEMGAIIDDVPKVVSFFRNWTPGQNSMLIIEKSKGGRNRVLDFNDRVEKFLKVQEASALLAHFIDQKGWKTLKIEDYKDLKNTATALGEIYTGSHAFRVNYAQRRYQELIERGLSEKEALKIVTEELGHNRPSMARAHVFR